jgi:hypothetical protein
VSWSQRVFPYISVMVNNGSLSYDHSKDGRWTELAGCTADFRNRDHDTFLAVRYSRGRLTVSRHAVGRPIEPVLVLQRPREAAD